MKVVVLLKLNIHFFLSNYVIFIFIFIIKSFIKFICFKLLIIICSIINLNSMNIFLFHFLNISNSWKTTSQSPNRY
jgi:hypothetical protein